MQVAASKSCSFILFPNFTNLMDRSFKNPPGEEVYIQRISWL